MTPLELWNTCPLLVPDPRFRSTKYPHLENSMLWTTSLSDNNTCLITYVSQYELKE